MTSRPRGEARTQAQQQAVDAYLRHGTIRETAAHLGYGYALTRNLLSEAGVLNPVGRPRKKPPTEAGGRRHLAGQGAGAAPDPIGPDKEA